MAATKLIFIYGLPATGKLTIAQELATITGYKLFHNHLAVDLLLSVFDFGSAPFIELREDIWLSIFDQACLSQLPGLIFTFNPETTVRPSFIQATEDLIANNGCELHFIELVCPLAELKRRIDNPSRREFRKLTSLPLFEQLHASGTFDSSHMPPPELSIDTSLSTPTEAAALIAHSLELPQMQ